MKKACISLSFILSCAFSPSAQTLPVCTDFAPPGADNCADACLHCSLNGYSGSTAGFTAGTAPGFCGAVDNDQWLGFLAGSNNITITVTPGNCAAGNGIEIALYSACAANPLVCTPGQAGGGSTSRSLTAQLVPDQPYFLMVDGFGGDQCQFIVQTSPNNAVKAPLPVSPGPPQGPSIVAAYSSNVYSISPSLYANRYIWSGPPGSLINGQPTPVQIPAPAGSQVTVTFSNESGTVCAKPANACGNGPNVCRNVSIGGPLAPACMSNTQAADFCADACVICNFTGYSGSNSGYSADAAPGFCGTVESNLWLGFIASQAAATFMVTPSNCLNGNGLQLALYQNCSEAPLICYPGLSGGGDTPAQLTVTDLQPNQQYFLMIDGYAGDECDFTVQVIPPQAVQAPGLGAPGPISGPVKICPGATVAYRVDPVAGAGGYTWTAPAGWLINGHNPPYVGIGAGANAVTITAGNSGGQLSVTALNNCAQSSQRFLNITVQPIPVTNLPPVKVCAEDSPFLLPWGAYADHSDKFCVTYTSYQGCDSVVCQQVTVMSPIIFIYPPHVLCEGEAFVVCGEAFSAPGNYIKVCESYQGCDSSVYFSLIVLDPAATILPPNDIYCAQPPVILNSAAVSNGVKIWRNQAGQVLSNGDMLSVNESGIYSLTVTVSANGKSCVGSDTVQVIIGNTPPSANASGGILNCNQDSVQLSGSSSAPGAAYFWTGPGGFSSGMQNPVAYQPGQYVLTVTDPQSGCTNSATATVSGNTQEPGVSLSGGVLTCASPSVSIHSSITVSTASFSWQGPNGFTSTVQNPLVDLAGSYLVTVTDLENGCTASGEIAIPADFSVPTVLAAGGTISCANPSVTLFCATNAALPAFNWVGPDGFSSALQNPQTATGGEYEVTVTDVNGCTAAASVFVETNINVPSVSVPGDTLTCETPAVSLMCSTSAQMPVFAWNGPGGFVSNIQNPQVVQAGVYSVTVTDPSNGCTNTATSQVTESNQAPVVEIFAASTVLNCALTVLELEAISSITPVQYHWSGPGISGGTQGVVAVSQPGTYSVVVEDPASGCKATELITIVQDITPPGAQITGGGTLTCAQPLIQLDAVSATPGVLYSWSGPGLPPGGAPWTVDMPGVYTLLVFNPANGCTDTESVVVSADQQLPEIILSGDTLTCAQPGILLECQTTATAPAFSWSGPNNFTSGQQNPEAIQAGIYTVTVTNTANGCTNTANIAIVGAGAPQIQINTPAVLSCLMSAITLQSAANVSPAQFQWTGPNGFSSTQQNPTVEVPGLFTLIVTDPASGCSGIATATVGQDIAPPQAETGGDTLTCVKTIVQLIGLSSTPNAGFVWTGPGIGVLAADTIVVDQPGIYTLEVTNPANGCTRELQAIVMEDITPPEISVIQVTKDVNGQGTGSIQIAVLNFDDYTVVWKRDTAPIGSGNAIFGLTAGLYTAVVTGSNGCMGSIDVVLQDSTVAVQDVETANDWIIFPNPTTDHIRVQYLGRGPVSDLTFHLLDMTGRIVQYERTERLDPEGKWLQLNGHLPGTYVLLIRAGGFSVRLKVILLH